MPVYWGIYKSKIKENKSKDGVEGFSCILREPQRSVSNNGGQGGGVVKLPPGFHGNAEADYSDASFTVNSHPVSIKPLTVPFFFFPVGFSRTTAKFERAGTLGRPYNYP